MNTRSRARRLALALATSSMVLASSLTATAADPTPAPVTTGTTAPTAPAPSTSTGTTTAGAPSTHTTTASTASPTPSTAGGEPTTETTAAPSTEASLPATSTASPSGTTTAGSSSPSAAPEAGEQKAVVDSGDERCEHPRPLTLFNINDFHGRIENAAALFTPVEAQRDAGGDVLLLSAGDNIGASTFVSMTQDDLPTIKILNAAGLAASSVGNHEFDGGWAKLRDFYIGGNNPQGVKADFEYLAANMTGTTLAPYTMETTTSGLKVAVIGAQVRGLAGLVSPDGIAGITVSDEVAAVNDTAAQAKAAGADIVVAEVHNNIKDGYSADVDVVFNGHTHEEYAEINTAGQPVVQSGSYGANLGQVDLEVGDGGVICGRPKAALTPAAASPNLADPEIAEIDGIYQDAKVQADIVGAEVLGDTCGPIQRGVTSDGEENRAAESTMTDMVAQMFYDQFNRGNHDTIGLQNPGGTRADLDDGEITYAEANAVLPFANTVVTAEITGAQLKTVLEQQWQKAPDGSTPKRPYLQLGLSENVSYTYDESLPEGSRITGITINGAPYDPAKTYTVVSGSFLIAGGDNFHELANAQNVTDTGASDLSTWVAWLKKEAAQGQVCQNNTRRAVSLKAAPVTCDAATEIVVGMPQGDAPVAGDTLDFTQGAPTETTLRAFAGDVQIGAAAVVDGVARFTLQAPAGGEGGRLSFRSGNGTVVYSPMEAAVEACGIPTVTVTDTATVTGTATGTASSTTDVVIVDDGTEPPLAQTGVQTLTLAALALMALAAGALALRASRRR